MTHQTRISWLIFASLGLIAFGLLNFLALFTPLFVAMNWF